MVFENRHFQVFRKNHSLKIVDRNIIDRIYKYSEFSDSPIFVCPKISMHRMFRHTCILALLSLLNQTKYLGPLSTSDPVAMRELLPNLINSIRMIHTISRYYNTSERMTSLFVKVTNQMIKSCRNYIMQGSSGKIWDQNEDDVLARIDACIALNDEYQGEFQFFRKHSHPENPKKQF